MIQAENHNMALNGMKKMGLSTVNIGAEDLIEGKETLALGVLFRAGHCPSNHPGSCPPLSSALSRVASCTPLFFGSHVLIFLGGSLSRGAAPLQGVDAHL